MVLHPFPQTRHRALDTFLGHISTSLLHERNVNLTFRRASAVSRALPPSLPGSDQYSNISAISPPKSSSPQALIISWREICRYLAGIPVALLHSATHSGQVHVVPAAV